WRDQRTGYAKDRARSARARHQRMRQQTQQAGGNTGVKIKQQINPAAEDALGQRANAPQTPHIGGDVNEPNVQEHATKDPPRLASKSERPKIRSPSNQLRRGWPSERNSTHQHRDE